ncbi:hypothetical protein MLD38_009103 [Melastoma candidum]|nr:hypothetical protein MLD38_009103 [Melastoma candidum]
MVNVYPFFAYESNSDVIPLDYALFRENPGVIDPGNGLHYFNLFDAQLDAVFAAASALGFDDVPVVLTSTVYLFALFNENKKTGPTSERNYGLFYPSEAKVYDIPFTLEDLKKYKDVRGAPVSGGGGQSTGSESGGVSKEHDGTNVVCGEQRGREGEASGRSGLRMWRGRG